MNILFDTTREYETQVDHSQVIISRPDFQLSSNGPNKTIKIDSQRALYLWGDVYAVEDSKGAFQTLADDQHILLECLKTHAHAGAATLGLKLEGNFVAALIDEQESSSEIFTDSFNRTEVFYHRRGDRIVASTDLEFLASNGCMTSHSQQGLANFFSIYGYYAPKRDTIYSDVNRLGVGESFKIQNGKCKLATKTFEPRDIESYTEQDHSRYSEIFTQSVLRRASSGMNWVLLSSGWDSTSILTVLAQHVGIDRVRAVIGKMRYSDRAGVINEFEVNRAIKFANHFGVQLDVLDFDLSSNDALEAWEGIHAPLRKQHIYSFSAYNFHTLTEFVKENGDPSDAIFAGEISDGIHNFGFSQSATILEHPVLEFREYSDKMATYMFGPTFFQSVLDGTYKDDFVYRSFLHRLGSENFISAEHADEAKRRRDYFLSLFCRGMRVPFSAAGNSSLLTANGVEMLDAYIYDQYLKEAATRATPESLYSWILQLYNSFHWQGGTVRCFGANLHQDNRRIAMPFWDGQMHEFLSVMPEHWGRGLEMKPTKYPLKWTLENELDYPMDFQKGPHSYLYDVDPQFNHVSEILYGSAVSKAYKERLEDHRYMDILDGDVFDRDYLHKVVSGYLEGDEVRDQRRSDLMAVATLSMVGWY